MTTAFVLSGGGSLGAVQVGMLQALGEAGIVPDVLVGTSAGAVNAAWVAGRGMSADSLEGLAALWGGLRRRDVFPIEAHRVLRGVIGATASICSADRFAALLRRHAGYDELSDAVIDVHLLATDLLTGLPVLISHGPVDVAVRASAALPGVFPPVLVEGRHLVDGGVVGGCGVAAALELGVDEIYVLPAGVACALARPPRTAVGIAVHALTLLIEGRLVSEVATVAAIPGGPVVRVIPPLCPLRISPSDFSQAADLVRRGHDSSVRWLSEGGTELPAQHRFLALHEHPSHPDAGRTVPAVTS
jgi:NTE family protein